MKLALIIGAGQDSSYLSEFLIDKKYKVIVVRRRSSAQSLWRFQNVINNDNFSFIEGDITDHTSLLNILSYYKPQEIYNLAAQSNVGVSFNQPNYTFQVCAQGVFNLLECIKFLKLDTKLYQASSSEMFGSEFDSKITGPTLEDYSIDPTVSFYLRKFQNENTKFKPQSPYAIAKLAAHNAIGLYRDAFNIWAVGGILFNHESPRRGSGFVTRKITKWVNDLWIYNGIGGKKGKLSLGNLNSYRDWGYAKEFVEMMWLMLQQDKPKDYVIGTGETHTVKEFLQEVLNFHKSIGPLEDFINIDENCKRPAEVPYLRADASLAEKELGWKPKTKFKELVEIMCREENGQE